VTFLLLERCTEDKAVEADIFGRMAEVDAIRLEFPIIVSKVGIEVDLGKCKFSGIGEAKSGEYTPIQPETGASGG